MKRFLTKLLATFFFLGYSPFAPGTVGTLGGVVLFYLLSSFSFLPYISFLIGFIIFSIWISGKASEVFGNSDPGQIVIDEVCGYLITMFLISPSLKNIILGFLLFRIFDIVKPPPIRRLEGLKGGFGIVSDDVMAGIYTNIILQLITRVF